MTNSIAPTAAWAVPTDTAVAPAPAPIPLEPAPGTPYQHLFREPGRRWWRPLASLGLFIAIYVAIAIVMGIILGVVLVGTILSAPDLDPEAMLNLTGLSGWTSVGALLLMNLVLAALIPAVLIANRVAHRLPAGYTHSVAGRFRFGWAAVVTAVLVPVWLVYIVIAWFLEPVPLFTHIETPAVTLALIAVCLLTTPLQAAGEEYFFRGWLMQNIGVTIPRPVVALVVPTIVSAALFSLAHGSLDPWIIVSLAAMAVAACWMTWRTGGLEAAVAFHTVNNVVIIVGQAAFGVPLMANMVTDGTAGTVVGAALGIVSSLAAMGVVEVLARRQGITATR